MKSTVEQLTDTRVKITVEVPFDELNSEFDNAYKAIAQQVQIPGFRRGKAPRQLIDARYGRGPVLEQVINDMLPDRYGKAVEEHDLKVMGQPDIDITTLEDGDRVEFTAEVDVRPAIELPDFTSYKVEVSALVDTDTAVDKDIEQLRQRFRTLTAVDRAVKDGDVITIDLAAAHDGEAIEAAAAEDLEHEVGNGELIDGLDEAVIGLSQGESTEFTTTELGGEFKDKEVTVTVTVKAVKEPELPEVNDEFVQTASEHDTVEELRASMAEAAEERVKADQAAEIRDAVLGKALEEVSFELPEGVVQEQVDGQLQQILSQFGGDEKIFNSLLQGQGMTREQYDKDSRERAESAVRTQLFLDALAEKVQPSVGQEEFFDHIRFTAQNYNMEPSQFLQQMSESGQMPNLFADVRRGKALAAAICEVSVVDSEGNSVDPSIYFGEEEAEAPADDAAENTTSDDKE